MSHAMNPTRTNMETSQETEANTAFKHRAIMREIKRIQKRSYQLMMVKSTTLPSAKLRNGNGNVYSTGNVNTRSKTSKYTYTFFLSQTAHSRVLFGTYLYICLVFAGTLLYMFPVFTVYCIYWF